MVESRYMPDELAKTRAVEQTAQLFTSDEWHIIAEALLCYKREISQAEGLINAVGLADAGDTSKRIYEIFKTVNGLID